MIKREKKLEKEIALRRIEILLSIARKTTKPELSRRYVTLAKRISEHYRVAIPKEHRNTFCKNCCLPYRSDKSRIRVKKSRIIMTCSNCGNIRRIPIRPQQQKKEKLK